MLGAAVLRFSAAGLYVAFRRAEGSADVMDVASLVAQLTIPLAALGFLVGLVQWQVYSGGALAQPQHRPRGRQGPGATALATRSIAG